MRDRNKSSKRRMEDGIQRLLVGGRIRDELIPDTEVDRQPGSRLPLILSVSIDFNFAEVARRVHVGRDRSNKEDREALKKAGKACKGIGTSPPAVLGEVALHPANESAELEAVGAFVPDDVVGYGELVLHLRKRSRNTGAEEGKTGDGDSAVLVPLVEIESGYLLRIHLVVGLFGSREAEAKQVYHVGGYQAAPLHGSEVVAGDALFRPARR